MVKILHPVEAIHGLDGEGRHADTINTAKGILLARPGADGDLEVTGLVIKTDAAIGELSGQGYGEGQGIVLLSQSDAPVDANTTIGVNIASTTNTTPVQVNTSAAHGASTGDVLRVTGTGISALDNKWWKVTVVDTDSVTLDGSTAPGTTASQGYLFGNRSPLLFRIDPLGGFGGAGGIHVGRGIRGQPGQSISTNDTGVWIDPSHDLIPLLINNANTTKWPAALTRSLVVVQDTRGGTFTLFEIDKDGVVRSNKGAVIKGRVVGDHTLTLERITSQTGALFRTLNASGAMRFTITGTDTPVFAGLADDGSTQVIHVGSGDSPLFGIRFFAKAQVAGTIPAFFQGAASQTADLTRWVDSGNGILTRIDKGGRIATRVTTAPADGDVANSEAVLWASNGRLQIKAKTSGGTVRNYDVGGAHELLTQATTGATYQVDLAQGRAWQLTLGADTTISVTGAVAGVLNTFTLILVQDGTGGRSPTFNFTIDWLAAGAPSMPQAPGDRLIVVLMSTDGGATWIGSVAGSD